MSKFTCPPDFCRASRKCVDCAGSTVLSPAPCINKKGGVSVQGGFNGFWALAARLYPSEMRSTGIGWALGVGRIGAVLGPVVGGFLVGAHVAMPIIFAIYAVPLTIAVVMTLKIKV